MSRILDDTQLEINAFLERYSNSFMPDNVG